MDASGTNQEFFYNLIPGAIFSTFLFLYFFWPLLIFVEGEAQAIFLIVLLVIFGLFFGFLLQGITRFFRDSWLFGKHLYYEVAEDSGENYNKAVNILLEYKIIDKDKIIDENQKITGNIKNKLHLMDNYLRAAQFKSTTEHFAAKSAFWSNILLVSIAILATVCYFGLPACFNWIKFVLFLLIPFSYCVSRVYYKSQYDVVIKSFLTVVQIDKQEKRSRKIRPSAQ